MIMCAVLEDVTDRATMADHQNGMWMNGEL